MRNRDDDDRGSRRGRDDDDDRRSSRGRDSGSSRGGFVYKQRSAEENRKRAENTGRDFESIYKDGVNLYKVKDGDNSIRVLPPTFKGAQHYGLDIQVHFGIGPDRATYLCLNKMLDKPCPICEARQEAQRDGDDELAKELAPKQRVLVALIDRDDEKAGVQIWGMPWTVDRDLAQVAVDRKTKEVLPIDHPEEGYDVFFTKTGKERNTKYGGISVDRQPSELGRRGDEWLDWIQEHPLDTLLNYASYDDIAKAFNGGGSGGGSRKRDRSDDDDDRYSRRDRDYDRKKDDALSWDDVHGMKPRELEDLAAENGIKSSKYDDDEELADAICEKLDISKPKPRRSPGRDDDDDDDRSSRRGRDDDSDGKTARRRSNDDDDDDDTPRTRRRESNDDDDAEEGLRKMRRRAE